MGNTAEPIQTPKPTQGLFKVSPYMVIPSRVGGFSLYLRQDDRMVLYAEKGVLFTEEHKNRLGGLDVDHLYIKAADYPHYAAYLHENLQEVLDDDTIPVKERARAWNDATVSLAKQAFDRTLPKPMDKKRFQMVRKLVQSSLKFLARDDAMRELARFLKDGHELFNHGIGVMVLTVSVMATYVKDDADLLVAVGMGAMLHDIGKLELPEDLFTKKWANLSQAEQDLIRSHPALGVGVCSSLTLPQETLHCILFHHEHVDGSGYPSGAHGDMLPSYVRVLSLCNEYDNLTRNPEKVLTPFEALNHIKAQRSAHDPEMLKRLIAILSKANLT